MPKGKKLITLTGKAADQAFRQKLAEIGTKTVYYPFYPLRDGYRIVRYSLDGKERPIRQAFFEDPLTEAGKRFVRFFTDGVFDMGLLLAFLQQHCNITNPSELTWREIWNHLTVLAQAKHITVETIDKNPDLTFSGQTSDKVGNIEYSRPLPMTKSEKPPEGESLVRIEPAIDELRISHSRVKQAARDKEIYSEQSGGKPNSPYLVYKSEVQKKFSPHGPK